jgi:hypothetical protein
LLRTQGIEKQKTNKQKRSNKIQNKAKAASEFLLADQIQGRHGADSCFVRSPETTSTRQFKKNQTNPWKNTRISGVGSLHA